ncbi:MAG: choice-of-anchor I family protein [Planctomycetota bacterium]
MDNRIPALALALVGAVAVAAPLRAQSSTTSLRHSHLSTVQSSNAAGEIVGFDPASGRYFVTNPESMALDVFVASPTGDLSYVASVPLAGGPNSVAVHSGLVAVAVEGATKQDLGVVQFFDAATLAASGASVTVGALPDMVIFTPSGDKVLTANEGEADEATGLVNPEGSISIVDVASRTALTASFAPWNSQKAALQAAGVRLSNVNGITLAQDVEPEYLAIDAAGTTAFVTLQENNALAEVDIATATVTAIRALGEKDHGLPGNQLDPSNQDGIDGNLQSFPVRGLYMPDALASFSVGGVSYLATANEGDGRDDYAGFADETRGADLESSFDLDTEDATPETGLYTSAQLNDPAVLGRLKFATSDYDIARGDTDSDGDVDQLYSFGARSFSIWNEAGTLVFDSGDAFEREMLARGLWEEGRSDDKGPEPESIAFGVVDGTPLLFIGLERTDAVVIYSVSNPAAPVLVDVIDVASESGVGAAAPEGLKFIPASDSGLGRALLAVVSESDGALSLFAIDSGAAGVVTVGQGCPAAQPLVLASNAPRLASSWDLLVTGVPASAGFCTVWFGADALPAGVALDAIGSTGCFSYIEADLGAFVVPSVGGSGAYSVGVPGASSLIGFSLATQASAFVAGSFVTSNGLVGLVGS